MIHRYTLKDWRRVTVRSYWTVSGSLSKKKNDKQWYIPVISYWFVILHFICDDYHLSFLGQGAHGHSLKVIILLTKCNNNNLSILLCILLVLVYIIITALIWFTGRAWRSLFRGGLPSSLSNTIFADDCINGT